MFFDTHAHIDGPKFDVDRDEVLARAKAAGVTHIVCIGASDGMKNNRSAIALAEAHEEVWATVGVHPHDAAIVDPEKLAELEALAAHPKVVAVGETGLDYYYDTSPRERQREVFRDFVAMARRVDKPLVVHTRDADEDTAALLEAHARGLIGVVHCFTGGPALAARAVALGWYVSFSGILTFRNAEPLRAIARELPRDRVLVETDCPYLAPIPHRGKRNEPAFVAHVAEALAELWETDAASVREITGENAARFYRLDRKLG